MAKKIRQVTVIHADGRPDTVSQEEDPGLIRLQHLVGGFFELIPCFNKYKGLRTTWVYGNEEAKLRDLPLNRAATIAWRQCDERITDHLRGDVVVVQPIPKQ